MMEQVNVYLGLGTNEGDRDLNLIRAMNLLDQAFGTPPERISRIMETTAWGFDGPAFLNLCALFRLPLQGTPEEHAHWLLRQVKGVEKALGRTDAPAFAADGKRLYHNRPIDIDILCYGTYRIETEALTIPHPRIGQRDFAKLPLMEIAKADILGAFPEIFA